MNQVESLWVQPSEDSGSSSSKPSNSDTATAPYQPSPAGTLPSLGHGYNLQASSRPVTSPHLTLWTGRKKPGGHHDDYNPNWQQHPTDLDTHPTNLFHRGMHGATDQPTCVTSQQSHIQTTTGQAPNSNNLKKSRSQSPARGSSPVTSPVHRKGCFAVCTHLPSRPWKGKSGFKPVRSLSAQETNRDGTPTQFAVLSRVTSVPVMSPSYHSSAGTFFADCKPHSVCGSESSIPESHSSPSFQPSRSMGGFPAPGTSKPVFGRHSAPPQQQSTGRFKEVAADVRGSIARVLRTPARLLRRESKTSKLKKVTNAENSHHYSAVGGVIADDGACVPVARPRMKESVGGYVTNDVLSQKSDQHKHAKGNVKAFDLANGLSQCSWSGSSTSSGTSSRMQYPSSSSRTSDFCSMKVKTRSTPKPDVIGVLKRHTDFSLCCSSTSGSRPPCFIWSSLLSWTTSATGHSSAKLDEEFSSLTESTTLVDSCEALPTPSSQASTRSSSHTPDSTSSCKFKPDSVAVLGKYLHLLVPQEQLLAFTWTGKDADGSSAAWCRGLGESSCRWASSGCNVAGQLYSVLLDNLIVVLLGAAALCVPLMWSSRQ